jgi:hypothetical protein
MLGRSIATPATAAATAKGSQGPSDEGPNCDRYPVFASLVGFFFSGGDLFGGFSIGLLALHRLVYRLFRFLGGRWLLDFDLDRRTVDFDFYSFLGV